MTSSPSSNKPSNKPSNKREARDMVAVRYIYVTDNMQDMLAFYRDVLGMPVMSGPRVIGSENDGFVELGAGSFVIALHRSGTPGVAGHCRHKLVFTAADVPAEREALVAKG